MSRDLAGSLEDLKRDFDESFALPLKDVSRNTLDFLAISAGSTRCLLRVSELSALQWRKTITPLPSTASALLGIAGFRGRLIPVYRLAALLGNAQTDEGTDWLAVCQREEPVALAFGGLDGHLRVPAETFHRATNQQFVEGALRLDSDVRHVLDVPAILGAIRNQTAFSTWENRHV